MFLAIGRRRRVFILVIGHHRMSSLVIGRSQQVFALTIGHRHLCCQ